MRLSGRAWRSRLLLGALLAAFGGCSSGGESTATAPAGTYVPAVKEGMTLAEVEGVLGPGEEVAYKDLPEFYRSSLAKGGEAGDYRRWVKTEGDLTTTTLIEFIDGKAGNPFMESRAK